MQVSRSFMGHKSEDGNWFHFGDFIAIYPAKRIFVKLLKRAAKPVWARSLAHCANLVALLSARDFSRQHARHRLHAHLPHPDRNLRSFLTLGCNGTGIHRLRCLQRLLP